MKLEIWGYNVIFEVKKIDTNENPITEDFQPVPYEPSYQDEVEESPVQDDIDRLRKMVDNKEDEPDKAQNPEKPDDTAGELPPQPTVPKIMEECSELISEFESYKTRFETEEGKMTVEMIQARLTELLTRYGARLIIDDKEFDILRHTAVPAQIVDNGIPIQAFISPGIILENKVLIRAQVKI